MKFDDYVESLTSKIKKAYEESVTTQEAENLAGEFLYAMLQVSKELSSKDLDARMRKTGLKAIKAGVYMEAATKTEKKPSDTLLEHLVAQSDIVREIQNGFDTAEVEKDALQNTFNIFKEAHLYFRGISKSGQ